MYIRPTSMASAFLDAALRADNKAAQTAMNDRPTGQIIIDLARKDDPARPFKSGYNVPMVDKLHVSKQVLAKAAQHG